MTWICLIDADAQVRDVLTEALRNAGHGVLGFRDGGEAISAIEGSIEAPRLVVLDVLLPLAGRDVLQRIRTSRRTPDVPVIVITGMDVDEDYFSPWPILGVLPKPIVVAVLLKMAASALQPRGVTTSSGARKK